MPSFTFKPISEFLTPSDFLKSQPLETVEYGQEKNSSCELDYKYVIVTFVEYATCQKARGISF